MEKKYILIIGLVSVLILAVAAYVSVENKKKYPGEEFGSDYYSLTDSGVYQNPVISIPDTPGIHIIDMDSVKYFFIIK